MAYKVLVAAAVVGLLGVASFAYRAGWLPFTLGPSAPGEVANPSLPGTLVSTDKDSAVIAFADGTQKKFTLAPKARVISQVKTGEVGLSLAQFPLQAQVFVQPRSKNSSIIESITLAPGAYEDRKQAGPPVVWTGSVTAASPGSIAVTTQTGQVSINLLPSTVVVASVLAGNPGRTLESIQPGTYVIVYGYSVREGLMAGTIQVIELLQ